LPLKTQGFFNLKTRIIWGNKCNLKNVSYCVFQPVKNNLKKGEKGKNKCNLIALSCVIPTVKNVLINRYLDRRKFGLKTSVKTVIPEVRHR